MVTYPNSRRFDDDWHFIRFKDFGPDRIGLGVFQLWLEVLVRVSAH